MHTEGEGFEVQIAGPVTIFKINRPERHNALTWPVRTALLRTLEAAEASGDCRVLVITGAGDKVFCAGGDLGTFLEEISSFDETWPGESIDSMKMIGNIVQRLASSSITIISAVNGAAFGGGCCLALTADIVVASSRARFGFGFIHRGVVPDWGCFYMLPRLVGMAQAKNILLRGKTIGATEALNMGMIAECTDEQVLDKAIEIANEIAGGPKIALSLTKNILNRSFESSLDTMMAFEFLGQTIARRTNDHREGVVSFLEKRPPVFQGR
jgi:2-(1,2-epoxy-1,2-dihydrophenyl)acetyl-CoA isomerase